MVGMDSIASAFLPLTLLRVWVTWCCSMAAYSEAGVVKIYVRELYLAPRMRLRERRRDVCVCMYVYSSNENLYSSSVSAEGALYRLSLYISGLLPALLQSDCFLCTKPSTLSFSTLGSANF